MQEKEGLIKRSTNMASLPVSEYSERKREEQDGVYHISTGVKIEYPKALYSDYYSEKIERAEYKSKDWFLWCAFSKYAKAVRDFYCSTMYVFNKTIHQKVELENYINQTTKCKGAQFSDDLQMLDILANALSSAEKDLRKSMEINRTSIDARCNRHKKLQQLREYAATAWLVYDNFKVDNYFHAVVDFKTKNADKDMTQDRNIALVSMGHYKAKNFARTKVDGYFNTRGFKTPFKSKHGSNVELYENLDAGDLFENLLTIFNGYVWQQNEQQLEELQTQVTDKRAKAIIQIYKNFADIKYIYKKLHNLAEEVKKQPALYNYNNLREILKGGAERNIYMVGARYLAELEKVSNLCDGAEEYEFFTKDVVFLKQRLMFALEETYELYEKTPEVCKVEYTQPKTI